MLKVPAYLLDAQTLAKLIEDAHLVAMEWEEENGAPDLVMKNFIREAEAILANR